MILNPYDVDFIVKRLPREVRAALVANGEYRVNNQLSRPATLFLAGGCIRSVIAREEINDFDLFAASKAEAARIANELADAMKGRVYETDNAYTITGIPTKAVQIIHRWTFDSVEKCIESFDFTVARAGLYHSTNELPINYGDPVKTKKWIGLADDNFYPDLAAKRLVYRFPVREEEAGGSLLRLLKFYRRGYTAPLHTVAGVIARLSNKVDHNKIHGTPAEREEQLTKVLRGLLYEVDPNAAPADAAYYEESDEDRS